MEQKWVISQLEDLIRDRKSFLDKDEPGGVFQDDIDALRWAIQFIRRNGQ